MARKAIVDRDTVLSLLQEGKTSKSIAEQFGVSRQAIDLYRKQFVSSGHLPTTHTTRPAVSIEQPDTLVSRSTTERSAEPSRIPNHSKPATAPNLSLDELVDLVIQAFTALKRVKELETEISELRKNYDTLLQQVEQLQAREQKRKEQEARWIHVQSPGIITDS